MRWIDVRVTDDRGALVDLFTTNSEGFADARVARLVADFRQCEPARVLTVVRSDQE